jgi:hypothetical protein
MQLIPHNKHKYTPIAKIIWFEIFALLDVTQRLVVKRLATTDRSHLQRFISPASNSKMGPIGCPETSSYYQSAPRNMQEERRCHLHRSRSLTSHTCRSGLCVTINTRIHRVGKLQLILLLLTDTHQLLGYNRICQFKYPLSYLSE